MIDRYLETTIGGDRPDWSDLEVHGLAEIDGGWETSIYGLDVSYSEGGVVRRKPLVARFYQGDRGPAHAEREAAVVSAVAAAGMPVPKVEVVTTRSSPYGSAMVVMVRVDGAVLADDLSSNDSRIASMARWLAALHRMPVESVFESEAQPFEDPAFVAPDAGAMAEAVDRFGLDDFAPLLDWLTEAPLTEQEPSVLHGDYHPGNIIVDHAGGLTIIDWSFAGVGDYRLDVAWSALWTGAMAGAAARSELLAAYEVAARAKIEDLAYFEGLKLGARLLTVALWLHSLVEPPVPKINKAAIRGDYRSTVMTVYERFSQVTGLRLDWVEQL